MELGRRLAEYVVDGRFEDLPKQVVAIMKNVILRVIGTTIAGATEEGCEALLDLVREWGGKEEATILIHGGKVPAYNAAFMNATMARALDFDDVFSGRRSGCHVGAQSIPAALAAAELRGGCNGKEFLAALALGTEIAARVHFASDYDGFDATGVCGIFASTAVAGKILGLEQEQMLNALALAFNRAAGSNLSITESTLAVRFVEGFSSQNGIICAQLAQRGITGPKTFLEGEYGYFHLYTQGKYEAQAVVQELGKRFELAQTIFKRHPSCTLTGAGTDAILCLVKEQDLAPEDIAQIQVKIPPYMRPIVGGQFQIGCNPRVNAQFSVQYCIASALLRKGSKLEYFDESHIREPEIMELVEKIHIAFDQTLDLKDPGRSIATAIDVMANDGSTYHKTIEIPRGLSKNPLTTEEHLECFQDCFHNGRESLPGSNMEKIYSLVTKLEELADIRTLIRLLVRQRKNADKR